MPERQSSLDRVVAQLATQIASGTITPAPLELEALVKVCDNAGRCDLADRVRRWIGER